MSELLWAIFVLEFPQESVILSARWGLAIGGVKTLYRTWQHQGSDTFQITKQFRVVVVVVELTRYFPPCVITPILLRSKHQLILLFSGRHVSAQMSLTKSWFTTCGNLSNVKMWIVFGCLWSFHCRNNSEFNICWTLYGATVGVLLQFYLKNWDASRFLNINEPPLSHSRIHKSSHLIPWAKHPESTTQPQLKSNVNFNSNFSPTSSKLLKMYLVCVFPVFPPSFVQPAFQPFPCCWLLYISKTFLIWMNQRLLRANWNELRFRVVMVCCWDTHFQWGMIKQLSPVAVQSLLSSQWAKPKPLRKTIVQCRMPVFTGTAEVNATVCFPSEVCSGDCG